MCVNVHGFKRFGRNSTKTVFMVLNRKNQPNVPRIVKIRSSELTKSANSKFLIKNAKSKSMEKVE